MGHIVIISAPSGAGKNAVVTKLLERIPRAKRFVTTTTREAARAGERDGQDYHFIDKETFESKRLKGDFIEWNEFAGNFYGTEREKIKEAQAVCDILFVVIDVHGRKSFVQEGIPHLAIFLLPEDIDALRGRIERRGGVTQDDVQARLLLAKEEISQAPSYDYQVMNPEGGMNSAVDTIIAILDKEGLL